MTAGDKAGEAIKIILQKLRELNEKGKEQWVLTYYQPIKVH